MTELNKSRSACATILFVVLFIGTTPAVTAAEGETPPQEKMAQVAKGAKAWADHCGRCHNIRGPEEFTDDIWDVSVNHMRVRANLPAEVIPDIKAFLKSGN